MNGLVTRDLFGDLLTLGCILAILYALRSKR